MEIGQRTGGPRCSHALGHLRHARQDVLQIPTPAELQPHGSVARQVTGAGQHQVPHAGEAQEGEGIGALCHAQPADLAQAPGHQGGPGVLPLFEAVTHADRDRDDVLERPAQLGPDDVRAGVATEPGRGDRLLY